ncbi:MAG: hypothetical protein E7604_12685 [Ruminococcaceae bacterium]|nr:hypothetical protein [Oscillospiraceae bacterium]
MKQFITLLRIQLAAIGVRMTRKNATAAKKKSWFSGIGMAILWGIVAVSFMIMFGTVFGVIAEPFHGLGLDWLYMTLAFLMCSMFMLIGTVFLAKSQLFEAKDNALLLTMPIPPTTVLSARMTSLYLMNLLWGSFVLVPALVCRFWFLGFSLGILLRSLLLFLLLALFVLALSCLLGWGLSLISARIRSKTFVTVFLSLAFIGVYYYFVGTGSQRMMEMLMYESDRIAELLGAVVPLYWIGDAAVNGSAGAFLCSTVLFAVPFLLVFLLLSATFLKTVTASHGTARIRYNAQRHRGAVRSAASALLMREQVHLLSSAIYLLNACIGLVFLVAGAVIALVKYDLLAQSLVMFGADLIPAIFCGMAAMMLAMVILTPPSVSLEAKTLWQLRSMPVSSAQILLAKWKLHLVWCGIPTALLSAVGIVFFLRFDAAAIVQSLDPTLAALLPQVTLTALDYLAGIAALVLLPQLFSAVMGGIGLLLGLRFPNLSWTNEAQVIKQGTAVMLSMFGGLALVGIPALTVYFLRTWMPVSVWLLIWTAVFAVGTVIVYRVICGWGVRAFEKLSV